MDNSNASTSPLETAAGAAGPRVTTAFELLSNETRLAILLALWEAYDPRRPDHILTFSQLYERVGVRDSGNFSYHLDRLIGHFIAETDDGYRLRNAGLKIIQATIAGAGLDDRTLPPTEIDMSCYRCGAPVEISYRREKLYHTCTECEGNIGPDFAEERPEGTLMAFDLNPSGLADREPEDVFVVGSIKSLRDFGLLMRGICPECTGKIETSVEICDSHEAPPGKTCPTCGTGDEVRVSYVCSVCKYGDSYPGHAAIYDHPAVAAFCHKHGLESTYDIDDPEACGELWDHLLDRECTLVSEDPVRIRITVSAEGDALHLILDGTLSVVGVIEGPREGSRDTAEGEDTPISGTEPENTSDGDRRGRSNGPVLPDAEDCLVRLRRTRWPNGVRCPHCDTEDTIKKGTTSKDAQRYRCLECDSIFNDLTGTIFAERRLTLPEMFHVVRETDGKTPARIARQLDRSYKSILNFVHEVEELHPEDVEVVSAASVSPTSPK